MKCAGVLSVSIMPAILARLCFGNSQSRLPNLAVIKYFEKRQSPWDKSTSIWMDRGDEHPGYVHFQLLEFCVFQLAIADKWHVEWERVNQTQSRHPAENYWGNLKRPHTQEEHPNVSASSKGLKVRLSCVCSDRSAHTGAECGLDTTGCVSISAASVIDAVVSLSSQISRVMIADSISSRWHSPQNLIEMAQLGTLTMFLILISWINYPMGRRPFDSGVKWTSCRPLKGEPQGELNVTSVYVIQGGVKKGHF